MIQTNAAALLAAVNGASSKIKAAQSMPILDHVRIDGGSVIATDLEIEGCQRFAADGPAVGFYLQRAALKRILAKIGDAAIVLDTAADGNAAITLANGCAFTLAQADAADWPKPQPAPDEDGLDLIVPAATLRNMLERALAAASTDQTRPVLTSLLLAQHDGGFELAACDSYRLHVLTHGAESRGDGKIALLPRRFAEAVVERIKKLKPATVTIAADGADRHSNGHARIHVGDWTGSCRLVEGTFPNYRALFPDSATATAVLPAADMLAAIDMAGAVETRGNSILRLAVGPESSITLDSKMGAAFTAPLNVLYEKVANHEHTVGDVTDGMTIGYNGAFLADMIAAAQSDSPILSMISPLRPSWITSVGCAQCGTPIDGHGVSFRGLLMPIRLG